MGRLEVVPLLDVVREVHHTLTYRFRARFGGGPGQFIMIWIPGYDELPMALSYLGDIKGVTVHAYGDATRAFASFKPGDLVGVRGPYGNTFAIEGEKVLCVAGGTGMASIIAAIEAFHESGAEVISVLGARSSDELIFEERAKACGEVHISTDDGTRGFHGFAPALAKKLMDSQKFDAVATCGPERMMKAVVDLARARGIPSQASLERYMKCGIGICDACGFDDYLVCTDGPVFTGDQLAKSNDFGSVRRDASGRRIPV
ncbi:MAG TPA: dihydroorotate dehydrogenase electron transfer subunit [Thermoplasmata archaeon]